MLKNKLRRLKDPRSFSHTQLLVFALFFAAVGGFLLYKSFALNPNLPGDVNNDNTVNITDLSVLLSNYNQNYPQADFNSDSIVSILDLSILLTNYNRTYTPPPTPPPPPSGGGTTITGSQCTSRAAVAGAVIQDVTVTGDCTVNAANVTINNASMSSYSIELLNTANGAKILNSRMLSTYFWGADNVLYEGNTIDCQGKTKDGMVLWDDPAGDYPDGYTIRGNTFRNCVNVNPDDHSQAIYNGYARNGLIENNYFYNNGSTAHIFFTWWGGIADDAVSYPRNICVRGNTFVNPPGGEFHYFDINFRSEIPISANIKIDPDQWPNRDASNSEPRFNADC